jgi:hypothetical protein
MRHPSGFSVAFMLPRATETDDGDEIDEREPSHFPSEHEQLDEKGYIRLAIKRAEVEREYWVATLHDRQERVDEANKEMQRLDRLMSKYPEPQDDDEEDAE